jgi:hypothetical protein
VFNAGSPCFVEREASWHQQNNKAWNLVFTYICGNRLLALSSKLRVPLGQQSSRLELSGAHNTAEALGLPVGTWASRSHAAAASMEEPSL